MASVVLGHDVATRQQIWIGDIERRSGLYISGRSGMGKSALMVNMQIQDARNGHAIFFIDPHGSAITNFINRLANPEKTILIDPEDDDYSIGINPLACTNPASLKARTVSYTRAYNIFYKIWEENWGVWLQLILQNVLWAFIENQDYTLADVPMFLNPDNKDFRNHIIDNIMYNQAVADFWRYEFDDRKRRESVQQERVDAALTRINTFLTHPYIHHIIGQQKTTINFKRLLEDQRIILIKLSANLADDIKNFIGTILFSELLHTIRAREGENNPQCCIYIDEFHNFVTSDDLATLVTEGRKFGVAATFAHVERLGQLGDNQKLLGATQAMVNKVLFQQTVNDGREHAPEFAREGDEVKKLL